MSKSLAIDHRRPWRILLGIVVGLFVIALTRLPQLLSDSIALDGDEAIVGLMAKHVLEGKSLPMFFYGQSYGLAIFEALFGALFFGLLGVSELSLKVAMLCLWAIGCLLLVLALKRVVGNRIALITGGLLILCPAWSSWSMMARGHYVSGFAITCLCCWIASLLRANPRFRRILGGLLGVAAGSLYLTSQLWFVAFGCFAVALLWRHVRKTDLIPVVCGFILAMGIVSLIGAEGRSSYWDPNFLRIPTSLQTLSQLPKRVFVCLTGTYSYKFALKPGLFTLISALIWCAVLVLSIYRIVRIRTLAPPHSTVYMGCFVGMAIVLMASIFISQGLFGYRHLLPFTPFLVCILGIELGLALEKGWLLRRSALAALLILAVGGAGSLIEARNNPVTRSYPPNVSSEKAARHQLVRELEDAGVRHVYCLHPLFQWNITFSSQERVIARWHHPQDRVPEYPKAVDEALFRGERIALVGPANHAEAVRKMIENSGSARAKVRRVGGRYFWVLNPDIELLASLGFQLNRPWAP